MPPSPQAVNHTRSNPRIARLGPLLQPDIDPWSDHLLTKRPLIVFHRVKSQRKPGNGKKPSIDPLHSDRWDV